MGLFDTSIITKIKRNHGLEHATIHILSRRNHNLSLVGYSDWGGFTLYGPVDTDEVETAARQALHRLRQGEAELAIHPRCGTVLATTGVITGLAAFLAIGLDSPSRSRFRWASLPTAILAATIAAVAAQPVGLHVQREYTTTGDPGPLEIKKISVQPNAKIVTHRIETNQ